MATLPVSKERPELDLVVVVRDETPPVVEETLRSVLDQRYPGVALHVVGGGPRSAAHGLLRAFAPQLTSWTASPPSGLCEALDRGIEAARRGAFVGFLRAGDALYREQTLSRAFAERELGGVDLLYGDRVEMAQDGREVLDVAAEFSLTALQAERRADTLRPALFVRRERAPRFGREAPSRAWLNWCLDLVDNRPDFRAVRASEPLVRRRGPAPGWWPGWGSRLAWLQVSYRRYGLEPLLRYHPAGRFLRAALRRRG